MIEVCAFVWTLVGIAILYCFAVVLMPSDDDKGPVEKLEREKEKQ